MATRPPDLPALLPMGFHSMTLAEMRRLCVEPFAPLTVTRGSIMAGVESVDREITGCALVCDVWVDGSFLTQTINPRDADFLMCLDNASLATITSRQRAVIDWVNSNLKASHHVDSYVLVDRHDTATEWMRAYWLRQFGFSRQQGTKGIAVLKHV
jgi:hypothetical protein